jgi:beta-glucosidase
MPITAKSSLLGVAAALLSLSLISCSNEEPTPTVESPDQVLERWPDISSPAGSEAVEKRVDEILAKMTLEEKVGQIMQAEIQTVEPGDVKKYHLGSVLNGGGSLPRREQRAPASRWVSLADSFYEESMDTSDGSVPIPIIWGTDAVHGHNNLTGATIFPHNMGLGAARNPDLIREIGRITSKEVRTTGIDWIFAPTIAVAQNDRWGRTYESYSEVPEIVASYSAAMVKGMQGDANGDSYLQGEHLVATAKHFLGDGGTTDGDDQGNAEISEQELIDIHNAGYEPAIVEGVQTVMASFSSWNGVKMHGNKYLLTDALKERMGFDGFVVGDWNGHGQVPGCSNDNCPQAINAGLDMYMVPSDWKALITNTLAQVKSGEISQERLDDAVRRILRVKVRAGLFEAGKPSERPFAGDQSIVGAPEHRAVARQAVRESLVLLKNHAQVLPINPSLNVLVAGDGADNIGKQSGGWSVTWQGMGTTNEDFPGATSIYAGIAEAVENAGGSVELAVNGNYQRKPDVAVVVFGENPYAEGQGDRDSLEFEAGNKQAVQLLKKLKAEGIPVVSVFISGRPMWVSPEMNASDAFVAAWLPGSEGGGVADVLIAKADGTPNVDFKGKLSFSWPKNPLQEILNPHHDNYDPMFEYGYGLTYASGEIGPGELPEQVEGVSDADAGVINFYVGRALQPWVVYIHNHEYRQILNGAFASLPAGDVIVNTADKDVQEDALKITWKDSWSGRLTLEGGAPMNLNNFSEKGVISFDLSVDSFEKAGLKLVINCGDGQCKRLANLDEHARAQLGQGWQRVVVPYQCLVHSSDELSAVPLPFSLEFRGSGEVQISNIRFEQNAEGNVACPAYDDLSASPSTLSEHWALDWWQPRHEQKLAMAAKGDIDLIFIGDSITQGWEQEGKTVWDEYYADRKALNLGFSGDRTENVIWRLQNGEVDGLQPKLVVLKIGTNNTGHRQDPPALTAKGVKAIIHELQGRVPSAEILLLGVLPRGETSEDPLRQINDKLNPMLEKLGEKKGVHYLDIGSAFLDEEGHLSKEIMPDLLHLSPQGYAIWAEQMEATLKSLLEE